MNRLIAKWTGYDRLKNLLDSMPDQDGITFLESSARECNLKTTIHGMEQGKMKSTIFFCTHHSGAVDLLATYPVLVKAAPNLKVVINNELLKLKPLTQISIGVHSISTGKRNDVAKVEIAEHLRTGGNILIFPAGKVGGLKKGVVSDYPWRWGIAEIVKKNADHVVPVFVDSKNSFSFYMIRKIFPKLSMLFLLRVLKNRKQELLHVYVGKPINAQSYNGLTSKELINAIRHVTYKLKTEDHGNK